ncbi:AMP-dependent synthetase/ligase [Calidifontibacter terrae]
MVMTREFSVPRNYELTAQDIIARAPWRHAATTPDLVLFESYVNDAWAPITARDFLDQVRATARGLVASGIQPGDRVALMGDTRYEWMVFDLAIANTGAITVPIYPSSSAAQVAWILSDSGARHIVVDDALQAAVVTESNADVTCLVIDDGALSQLAIRGQDVDDSEIERRRDTLDLDQPASIVYTSGTTGRPKGCVLTHRNVTAEVLAICNSNVGQVAVPGSRLMMFLPLAHVLARAVTYAGLHGGMTTGFWSDFKTISDKFVSFRPHIILGVPRVFEKVHAGARTAANNGGAVKARIFARAEATAVRFSATEAPDRLQRAHRAVYDRLVFAKVRAATGGQCRYAISGGGALNPRLAQFFEGLGLPVYEGYGLTETCAAITVNQPDAHRIGTVGRPLPGNAVRVSDSGELQLRGDLVFRDYLGNEQATADAFDDGWFRTGDLGTIDEDGFVRITGRAKEILVTAGGKNVAPGPIEDALCESPLIGHAMLVGEGRPYIAALLTIDPEGGPVWAADHGVDLATLPENEAFRAEVQAAIDRANQAVSHAEGVKKFVLLPQDFSEEGGELTPTLKIKRHVVLEKQAVAVEQLYSR